MITPSWSKNTALICDICGSSQGLLFLHSKKLADQVHEEAVLFLRADRDTEPAVASILLAFAAQDHAFGLCKSQHFLARLAGAAAIEQDIVGFGGEDDEAGDVAQRLGNEIHLAVIEFNTLRQALFIFKRRQRRPHRDREKFNNSEVDFI